MDTTNNASRRRLSDHESVGDTTGHGRTSVAFGLLFVGAGAMVAFLVISDASIDETKRLLTLMCCGIFAAGGLTLVAHGLAGVLRTARGRQGRKTYPHEPWRWDHRWNDNGTRDESVKRLLLWTYRTLFTAAFVLPFNWLVFLSGELSRWALAVFGIGTILTDLMVVYIAYRFEPTALRTRLSSSCATGSVRSTTHASLSFQARTSMFLSFPQAGWRTSRS